MKRWLSLLLLGTLVPAGSAQMTKEERKGLEDTLYIGNLRPDDLNYARRPHDDKYRLGLVNLSIDKPLESLDRLMAIHQESATKKVGELIERSRKELYPEAKVEPPTLQLLATTAFPPDVPAELAPSITKLANAVYAANAYIRKAQSKLSPADLRLLLESLPGWAVEEKGISFEFVQQKTADQKKILELVDQVDVNLIMVGAVQLANAVDAEMANLKRLATTSKWVGFSKFKVGEMVVALGGIGDDTHRDRDARLVIDLGGNDRYYGRGGAGPGHAALSIDFAGDDHYKLPDVGAGCGLLGIGLAYDLGGHDNFRAKSLAFGSGAAGVGVFFKDGGDDSYQSSALTQGFGVFGAGFLIDTRGSDLFQCELLGQGAAKTMGWGQIIDGQGDDTYRAGGKIMNSPLFANVHYSNSQGFAAGYREDTGGISGGVGLLTDVAGDDAYIGETYCQAASYWYALGSLYDEKGLDTYRAYHYAQASAMHMCGAYLIELEGDDSYVNNFGAAHAIGHDYGAAVLFDRAGNDVYAGRDSRPGIGNANGVGIFIDVAGDDRYSGPAGSGNPARSTGSVGVFADLGGQDQYRTGLADGEAAVREQWGVGYDLESKLVTPPSAEDGPPPPPVGSLPRGTDEDLEKLYARATQWNVGIAQSDVRSAMNQLVGIGLPALEWMVQKKLAKASRLEQQAFVVLAKAIGHPGQELVAKQISGADEDAALVAMMIAIDGQFFESMTHIPVAIKKPKLARVAARLAGTVGAIEAADDLIALTASPDRLTALNAAVALSLINTNKAQPTALQLLGSPELPIRRAAVQILARFPDAVGQASALMKDPDETKARGAVEVLGTIGSREALAAIGPALADARPGIRISALVALNGRAPQELRQTVLDLRRDADERVRAVALRIDPGR